MGIVTDSLNTDFPMLISVIEATQPPGTVVHVKVQNTPVEHLEALARKGHIVAPSELVHLEINLLLPATPRLSPKDGE